MKIIKHFIAFNFLIYFLTLFFNLSITSPSNATTYCISNETDLLNALVEATSNGESDIIRVQQGEYYGNFIYASDEVYGVIIEGGYSEGCISQTINPENTIFDGDNNGRVLVLSSPTQTADFTIIGLKLQNGNGGSYYGGGLYINTEGNVSVNKNIINNNLTSGYWGGGINVENANTVTLSSNQINDNNATDGNSDGGGVHISANDTMTILIEKNTIIGNSAGRYGGGVRIWVPNSDNDSVTLINNIVSNNSANLGGAGVSIRGGNGLLQYIDTTYLINNTIVNNNCTGSEGGGLHLRLGGKNNIAFLYNNIIWNNTTLGGGSDVYINNDEFGDLQLSTANLYYNNFDQSAAGTYIKVPFSMDPSNLNNADPLFVDSENGDFHLTKDSPCVGSGTSQNAPDTDIDGDSRPLYDTYDIGADEYDDEYDGCPNDPNKTEPGICGCGVSDIDTDLDGVADCLDQFALKEIIGTSSNGIGYWDVATSNWTQMTSDSTTGDIAAGDFTGDGKADVASCWEDYGLWYQDGATLAWIEIDSTPPNSVTAGDVTGDGHDEIIGTWDNGIWYFDVAESNWTQMTSDSTTGDIAAGDFTGDGKADVASCWEDYGLWYQDGATLAWIEIDSTPPDSVTAGDVTGDGHDEIIGTWDNGIWYFDVAESNWTQMTSDSTTGDIAAGDFTGDGKADVASCWEDYGLWYQDGASFGWTKVSDSAPNSVTCGNVTGN